MRKRSNGAMALPYEFGSAEFHDAVQAATRKAFLDTLASGQPVFYQETEGRDVMELPDGRRFEICWREGSPSGQNYDVVRELAARAS